MLCIFGMTAKLFFVNRTLKLNLKFSSGMNFRCESQFNLHLDIIPSLIQYPRNDKNVLQAGNSKWNIFGCFGRLRK